MVRPLIVRMVLAAVLCAALGSGPVWGAEPRAAAEPRQAAEAGQGGWFGWFFDALAFLGGENGCRMDPYGGCGGAVVQSDNGCRPDPYGGCGAAIVQSDNGCRMDPFGGCGE